MSVEMEKIRKLVGRVSRRFRSRKEYYAVGSGLVHIPLDRINEASRVIQEHHGREAEIALITAKARGGRFF